MARASKGDFHEQNDLPWAKVWMAWYTTASHVELEAVHHGIGLYMLLLANRGRDEQGAGWVLLPSGKPMSAKVIARGAHASTEDVEEAIELLLAAGTVTRREDGAVGFPSLQRWQETPAAARMREARRLAAESKAKAKPEVLKQSEDASAKGAANSSRAEGRTVQEQCGQDVRRQTSEDQKHTPPEGGVGGEVQPPEVSGADAEAAAPRRPELALVPSPPSAAKKKRRGRGPPEDAAAAKTPRALWEAAELAGRGDDVRRVVEAYRRHQPQASLGLAERGVIAQRLLEDDLSPEQLIEAIDGAHLPQAWNMRSGGPAARQLEYLLRDASLVARHRGEWLEHRAQGAGQRTRQAERAWDELRGMRARQWLRGGVSFPHDLAPFAEPALKAIGGREFVQGTTDEEFEALRGRFMEAAGAGDAAAARRTR